MSIEKGKIIMFKRVLSISAAFIIVISSFTFHSFAVSSEFLNITPGQGTNGTFMGSNSSNDYYYVTNSTDFYAFRVSNIFYAINIDPTLNINYPSGAYCNVFRSRDNAASALSKDSIVIDNVTYYVGKYSNIEFDSYNSNIPNFNDLETAVNTFVNGSDNTPVSYTTHISLEPGCVLYIGSPSDNIIYLSGTTRFPMRSTLIGGDFPDSSQTFAYSSSLPASGTTFPLSGAQRLPWIKDQPFNVLGQSFNAKLEDNFYIAVTNQGFISIHNPYFVNVEDFNAAGDLNTNNTLELDITGYSSLRIYPLQDEVLNSSSPDNFNIYWEGTSTDNGDGTGTVNWTPTAEDGSDVSNIGTNPNNMGINGGGNFDTTSILQQIKQTLDNFVSSFISVISAPISHITELINAGSGFMQSLRGMYAWLPVDIQSLVIAALSVVIGIGVFKVFL